MALDDSSNEPPRFGKSYMEPALRILLIGVCAVSAAGAFVSLGGSSFWLDELYSVFIATGSLPEVLDRSLRYDAHPPLYEFFLHFWMAAFGTSEVALRLPSAFAAAALAPAWYWAARPVFSRWAALLLPAVCVTTLFWFDQSQQARSYAIVQLNLALAFGFVIRATAASEASASLIACMALIATALVASFLHFYAFLISGVMILAALILVRYHRPRIVLLAGGALIFILMVLLILARNGVTELHFQELWFANNWKSANVWLSYPSAFSGSAAGATVIVLSVLAAAIGLRHNGKAFHRDIQHSNTLRAVLASICIPVVASSAAVIIALAGMPTLQARNIALMAPFLWFAVIGLADWSYRYLPPWLAVSYRAICVIAVVAASSIVFHRPLSQREDWRSAGNSLAALNECRPSTIYVTNADTFPAMLKISPLIYGHYAPGFSFHAIAHDRIFHPDTIRRLAARSHEISAGREPCPVLLWSAHSFSDADGIRLQTAVSRAIGDSSIRLKLELFPHWTVRSLHAPTLTNDVFFISVARNGTVS